MPLIRLETTEHVPADARATLSAKLSRLCAEKIGKPERYVMVVIQDGVTMLHAGAPGPAAFADVRSIGGLSPSVNRGISEGLCRILAETLAVPGERVYANFTDVPAGAWGHDGSTFG